MMLRLGIIFEKKVLNYNSNNYNIYKAIDVCVGGWGMDKKDCSLFFPLKRRCSLYILDSDNKKRAGNSFDSCTYFAGTIDTNEFYEKYYDENVDYSFSDVKDIILNKWDGYYTLGDGMTLNRVSNEEALKECKKLFGTNNNFNNGDRKTNNKQYKTLTKYGNFLTDKEFLSNPAIDREKEIENIEIALLSVDKSALLVGESGVGKTAIVEGLAYNIKNGLVPDKLKHIKILSINTSALISGCKYVGMVEERLNEIINELKNNKEVILFIDEIHTIIGAGAGSKSNLDVANILKPVLDRGDIKIIGSTTITEYENLITDIAFKRRFKRINVLEQSKDSLFNIIEEVIKGLEKYYNIKFNLCEMRKTVLEYLIDATSERCRDYKDNVKNPDLVLSIIKDAFSISDLYNHNEILIEDILKALEENDRIYCSIREKYSLKLKELFKEGNFNINQKKVKVLKISDYN